MKPSRLRDFAIASALAAVMLLAAHCQDGGASVAQQPGPWGSSLPAETGDIVTLPAPSDQGGMPLREALALRRSKRIYHADEVSLQDLSQLLWAAQGVTQSSTGARTVPSAGALWPFEIYVVAQRVEGLDPGLYHYRIADHALGTIKEGSFGDQVEAVAVHQEWVSEAPLYMMMIGVVPRTAAKYGERAELFVVIEGGAIVQAVSLQVADLGLGAVCIGGFDDVAMQELIGTDAMPVVFMAIGHPAE